MTRRRGASSIEAFGDIEGYVESDSVVCVVKDEVSIGCWSSDYLNSGVYEDDDRVECSSTSMFGDEGLGDDELLIPTGVCSSVSLCVIDCFYRNNNHFLCLGEMLSRS